VPTYQLLDTNKNEISGGRAVAGLTITEAFPFQQGNLALKSGDYWSLGHGLYPNGYFEDLVTSGGGVAGGVRNGIALQDFTVSGTTSTGLSLIATPLTILGYGDPTPLNSNVYAPEKVTINGVSANHRCTTIY
jgi:hypothetical protein